MSSSLAPPPRLSASGLAAAESLSVAAATLASALSSSASVPRHRFATPTLARSAHLRPSWVKPAMQLYNIAQVVLCTYMAVGMWPATFPNFPNVFGIGTEYSAAGEWFILVHFLSKFMDWCDTLWMILKKKSSVQMSFLHLYHHATIGVVWGFLLSLGHGNGTAQYGAFINSVTHVIMYTHYFVTGLGINNPLKNWVTTWQITQFYSCFLHALCVLFFLPSMEVHFPRQLGWLQFCYHLTMIYLFTFQLRWVPSFLKTGDELAKEAAAAKKKRTAKAH